MSLGSKYDEINEFYALLNPFINTYDTTKKELWKISNNFTINALILTKIFTIVKRYIKKKKERVTIKSFK